MPSAIARQELFQWGAESTAGTNVAATERILLESMQFENDHQIDRTNLMRNFMMREVGDEIVVSRYTPFSGSGPLLYDQAHSWFAAAIEGGVSASGSGDNRTWNYTRGLTGVPDLDTLSIERKITDGTTNHNKEVSYGMLSSFSVDWGLQGPLTLSVEGFGRTMQAAGFTALSGADAVPVVEKAVAGTTIVYMDDAIGSVGTTQVSSKVLGSTLRFNTGARPQWTLDNRSDLDWTVPVYDPNEAFCELTLRCLLDPATSANGDIGTEIAKADAGAIRWVQMTTTGSDIGSGTDYSIQFRMSLKHRDGQPRPVGEENGQQIIEYDFVSANDGTTAWFDVVLVNARSAVCDGTPAA